MKKREPISKIMTRDVIALTLDDSLFDAERLFKKHHIRHIPVVDDDRIIGMLSLTDLLRISFVDSYSDAESIDTAMALV
ncbi:MAG: CBS domain-containing protein [Flavobacteriaceae bacterium]|nr:CBS domain-containing protein [Flavobacteriaceae bacterium]